MELQHTAAPLPRAPRRLLLFRAASWTASLACLLAIAAWIFGYWYVAALWLPHGNYLATLRGEINWRYAFPPAPIPPGAPLGPTAAPTRFAVNPIDGPGQPIAQTLKVLLPVEYFHTFLGFTLFKGGTSPDHLLLVQVPWWFIATAFAATALYSLRKVRRLALFPGLCPHCRYDLRAHAPGEKCPECGTTIPSQA